MGWLFAHWKGYKSGVLFIHVDGCLNSLNLVLKLGGLLESRWF